MKHNTSYEGLGKSFVVQLGTTPNTVVYEVPTGKKAQWTLLFLSNTAGATRNFNVAYYDDSAAATVNIFSNSSLSSGATSKFNANAFATDVVYMAEGDQIQAWAGTASSITAIITVFERNDVIQGG